MLAHQAGVYRRFRWHEMTEYIFRWDASLSEVNSPVIAGTYL